MPSSAGLIYNNEPHHLDHLAPLCALLQIPLLLTTDSLYHQAIAHYPGLTPILLDPLEAPSLIVSSFDQLFCSIPRPLFEEIFFFAQGFAKKKINTIWCPHGNSDKGHKSPWMEGLADETLLLTYGKQMEAFLEEKGVFVPTFRIGNYRSAYFQTHATIYSSYFSRPTSPSILYAPTWQDSEKNSSFLFMLDLLLDCPPSFHFRIKLHPHLYLQYPEEITSLKTKAPSHIEFIEDLSPIYPLLAKTDLYVGDMSSIGYDMLAFNKPLLLLSPSSLAEKTQSYFSPSSASSFFKECERRLSLSPNYDHIYKEVFSPYTAPFTLLEKES